MSERESSAVEASYGEWSDIWLVRAVTLQRGDYQPEALQMIERELARRGLSPEEIDSLKSQALEQSESENRTPSGIGGWLRVFLIFVSLATLSHGVIGWSVFRAGLSQGDHGLGALLGGLASMIMAGYGAYALSLLSGGSPYAPRHTRQFLVTGFLLRALLSAAHLAEPRLSDPGLIILGAITVLSVLYLKTSRRVANTYR